MMSSMGPVTAAGMNDSGVEPVETGNYTVQDLNFTGSTPSNSSNSSVNSEISTNTSTFPDLKTKGSKEGLVDPKVFVISSDANIKSINDAAYKVMELLNPVGNYDAPVSFEVRSYKQIEAMNDSDLKALIESSQIVIGEWISDTVNKKLWNLISTNKGLLNGKDFLMVDDQGTTSNLTRMNQVSGTKIFSGLSDSELSSLRLAVKNSNTTALETYRSRWSNSSSPQYNPGGVELINMALCYTQK
jgi:cobaltochelatase CobN